MFQPLAGYYTFRADTRQVQGNPLQVQQDAAGVRGVPESSYPSPPQDRRSAPGGVGAKGFELEYSGAVGGFPLSTCSDTGFPLPVSTRTSSAGITEQGARDLSLLGVGRGILGACNAPLQGFAVMVQRSAAGGLGVPPKKCRRTSCRESEGVPQFFFLSPQEWGTKGVENTRQMTSSKLPLTLHLRAA
jgi:hypothetical protein